MAVLFQKSTAILLFPNRITDWYYTFGSGINGSPSGKSNADITKIIHKYPGLAPFGVTTMAFLAFLYTAYCSTTPLKFMFRSVKGQILLQGTHILKAVAIYTLRGLIARPLCLSLYFNDKGSLPPFTTTTLSFSSSVSLL